MAGVETVGRAGLADGSSFDCAAAVKVIAKIRTMICFARGIKFLFVRGFLRVFCG